MFAPIPALWPDQPVVIIGAGPSLTAVDALAAYRACPTVITVNDAYRLLPQAPVLYAADAQWWNWKRRACAS